MSDWESLSDELAKRLIGDGRTDHLQNGGRRLDFSADRHVPEELRLAHKLLRDNDLVPSWVADAKALDDDREKLIGRVRAALARAAALPETLNAEVSAFNKRVLNFNLKAPAGVAHKRSIDLALERRRVGGG
ncbi:MAG: DUF1992 domain-containing protein [Anaerolineae bacterium]|jgi:hypothetical protein|nr:DUF1992 domain-containing protein [Anaerolineae bacterium]